MPWSTLTAPVAAEAALTAEQGAEGQALREINMLTGCDPSSALLGWWKVPKASASYLSSWEWRTFNRGYDPCGICFRAHSGQAMYPKGAAHVLGRWFIIWVRVLTHCFLIITAYLNDDHSEKPWKGMKKRQLKYWLSWNTGRWTILIL